MIEVTTKTVKSALDAAGIACDILWTFGDMGSILAEIGTKPDGSPYEIKIAVHNNSAHVDRDEARKHGHGVSRLPSHPLYPAPIKHKKIAAIEEAIASIK